MNVRSALVVGLATLGLTCGGLVGLGSVPVAQAASSAFCGTKTVNGVTTSTPCSSSGSCTVIGYFWGFPIIRCT